MTYPREWEEISGGNYAGYARLKVYGGWLVTSWASNSGSGHILFIADSKHDWVLEEDGGSSIGCS